MHAPSFEETLPVNRVLEPWVSEAVVRHPRFL